MPITNVPYEHNLFFTGREDVLQKLHEALRRTHAAALSQVQAISGLGGIGKTQTVVEYTYRYQHEYQAILWIRAESESTLRAGFAELAVLLGLPEQDAQNPDETVQAIHAWLTEHHDWLLIFDNADTPELLRNYRPKNHPHGHVLLTSRASVFDQLSITTPLTLPVLPANDAVDFLFRRTGRDRQNPQERDAATRLAEELGYLPLALEQAGAYIVEQSARVQDYLTSYRKRRFVLLQHTPPKMGDYPHSVVTTWSLNFQQVELSPGTADVLRLSAFLSPDDIPLDLLVKGSEHLSPELIERLHDVEHDPLVLNEVLEPLTRYSLIQRDVAMQTYSVHRMVQAVVRDQLDAAARRLWVERAMRAVNEVFPFNEAPLWSQSQNYLPHAITCLEQATLEHLDQWEEGALNNKVALYLRNRGQYLEAGPFFQSALAVFERLQGPEHPDTAHILNNLAGLYYEQGKYEQAEPLYQRALVIWEQALGPQHRYTARSLNNLGSLYAVQGKYEQAEALQERALAIREQVLGPEHPETASSLNNLASTYADQGKYEQAEALYQRALAIWEQVLGPQHPYTIYTLSNLAGLYKDQGKYEQAEALQERALAIREQVLGPEHPETASSLNNLASTYADQGKYEQAEALYQRALTIREQVLGPEHPDTARSLNNLAGLYYKQGKYEQAAALYQQALAIREQALGPEHPKTKKTREYYTNLLRKREQRTETTES